MTAAHRSLPFGTCVRVVNVQNGRSVQVRINDRGPFVAGRFMDVSEEAAHRLGVGRKEGLLHVRAWLCEASPWH
jgi:rare lipoprotein A